MKGNWLVSSLLAVAVLPNDNLFHLQWALDNDGSQLVDRNLDDYHTITSPGKSGVDIGWLAARGELKNASHPVTVAVIDYGADLSHPDLKGRIQDGAWDFITGKPLTGDPEGHGTHVAGIIAAACDNGMGICGVAPASVKVLPLKILDPNFQNFVFKGSFKPLSEFAADAVEYAIAHNADIINLSLGWPKILESAHVKAAIQKAINAGIVIVVAAGNDRKDRPTFPCSEDRVICVGAVSNDGTMSDYSNYGGDVHVLAPGDSIASTYPLVLDSQVLGITGYEILTGTSQAAPQVAGIAASLKSLNPTMTSQEIAARIFASAGPVPYLGAAQYGLVNLQAAISATPHPVYLANFLNIDSVNLDERSLIASGQVQVKNLWAQAKGFSARVTVNGKPAGSAQLQSFAGGGSSITIPWNYQFSSLEESSQLKMTLELLDANGTEKEVSTEVVVSRSAMNLPRQTLIPFGAQTKASDVMGTNVLRMNFSKLLSVSTYGQAAYKEIDGHPIYYKNQGPVDGRLQLSFFDTKDLQNAKIVQVPFMNVLAHVVRVDVTGRGQLDWVIIGTGKVSEGPQKGSTYIEFYFLDDQFKPLFGNNSAWQVFPENTAQASAMIKNFDDPNSWIKSSDGILLPSFMTFSTLPVADNFLSLDSRSLSVANHIFYLEPQFPKVIPGQQTLVTLKVRAVDTHQFYDDLFANFYGNFPGLSQNGSADFFVINPLPQSVQDMKAGHVRYIMADRATSDANLFILDISDTRVHSLRPFPGWSLFDVCGLMINQITTARCISRIPILAPPGGREGSSLAFLQFYTSSRGGMIWTNPKGELTAQTEFTFTKLDDPVNAVQFAFDIPNLGKFWYLQTQFELVSYLQKPDGSEPIISSFPLERETSNFNSNQFAEQFNAFVLGTSAQPIPALYVDSTLVRGNLLSMLIWNSQSQKLEKPLRYSISVPSNCLNMSPVNLTSEPDSFAIPFLCAEGSGVNLRLVQPQL